MGRLIFVLFRLALLLLSDHDDILAPVGSAVIGDIEGRLLRMRIAHRVKFVFPFLFLPYIHLIKCVLFSTTVTMTRRRYAMRR